MAIHSFSLKVVEKKIETTDTVTLCFKQPSLKKIKYLAGQYLTLQFRINGRKYIRPYSFSSAPGIDNYLEVTVKRVQGGIVSNHIIDKVSVGDVIEVIPPMGDFVLEDNFGQSRIVLWGVGSGITPLFSIAKYVLNTYPDKLVTLVYGNRRSDTVIFKEKIEEMKNSYTGRLSVWNFYTQVFVNENNPYLIQGRISPSKVLAVIKDEGEIAETLHFICGPAGLKESVRAELDALGVESKQIFSEDFELVKNPEDFKDIFTQTIRLHKDGEEFIVEVTKGKSILEACLDSQINMDYSCQTGNCKVCKGLLKEGELKTIGLEKRPDNMEEGEYLLCCAYPLCDSLITIS